MKLGQKLGLESFWNTVQVSFPVLLLDHRWLDHEIIVSGHVNFVLVN